jgi:hypothetical protein
VLGVRRVEPFRADQEVDDRRVVRDQRARLAGTLPAAVLALSAGTAGGAVEHDSTSTSDFFCNEA